MVWLNHLRVCTKHANIDQEQWQTNYVGCFFLGHVRVSVLCAFGAHPLCCVTSQIGEKQCRAGRQRTISPSHICADAASAASTLHQQQPDKTSSCGWNMIIYVHNSIQFGCVHASRLLAVCCVQSEKFRFRFVAFTCMMMVAVSVS